MQLSPFKVYQFVRDKFHKIKVAAFIPGFGFIKFTNDEYATKMLKEYAKDGINMDGHSIKLKQADCGYIPYEMYKYFTESASATSTPPTNNTGDRSNTKNAAITESSAKDMSNALNDICLTRILQRLTLVDLVNVSQTCKSLQRIALTVFNARYKNAFVELGDLGTVSFIEYFLKVFGESIGAINMKHADQCETILGLIGQYCPNIKTLAFTGHGWMDNPGIIDKNRKLFGRLEKVAVRGGFLAINDFLNTCTQLRVFTGSMIDCLDLRNVSLPHLTDICLSFFKCRGMGEFLIRHPHVEALEMEWPDPIVTSSLSGDTDQFIFRHLPNIRKMDIFEISNAKISHLCKMKRLKSVYLDGHMETLAPVVEKMWPKATSFETLELVKWVVDPTAITAISKMTSITHIEFLHCFFIGDRDWVRLIVNLSQLKEIWTSTPFFAITDEILPILKARRIKWRNEYLEDRLVSYVS